MAMQTKRSKAMQEAERNRSASERRRKAVRSIGVLLFEWRARMAASQAPPIHFSPLSRS